MIVPFLVIDVVRSAGLRRIAGLAAIGLLGVLFLFGFSKTPYIVFVAQVAASLFLIALLRRPRKLMRAMFIVPLAAAWLTATLALFAPAQTERKLTPLLETANLAFGIMTPLLEGDVRPTTGADLSTRFGLSAAAVAMWQDAPLLGVGIGQFAYDAEIYVPPWGLNDETRSWLNNDEGNWPTPTNFFLRMLAETGAIGLFAFAGIRVYLFAAVGLRLLDTKSPAWPIAMAVMLGLISIALFDFSRDSFINLDMWLVLAMAMAVIHDGRDRGHNPS